MLIALALVVGFCAACQPVELHPISLLRSVVVVDTGEGHGTGFVVRCELIFPDSPESGYLVTIATCAHVASKSPTFRIVRMGNTESDTAMCVKLDLNGDVALLHYASDKPIPCLRLADSEPDFGASVVGINYMLNRQPWISEGLWCGMDRTTVSCGPGGSGGPILHEGRVVGMTRGYIHAPHAQFVAGLAALRAALK